MCLLSFRCGSVWPSVNFDDATVGVRLWGGGIIYTQQSTQSGGELLHGTCVHLITGAELTERIETNGNQREAARHRVRKNCVFVEVRCRLLCSDTHTSVRI